MMVYEITAYTRCQREVFGESLQLGSLPRSKDEQIIGQDWDFQEKVDTTQFFRSTHGGPPALSSVIPAGPCTM